MLGRIVCPLGTECNARPRLPHRDGWCLWNTSPYTREFPRQIFHRFLSSYKLYHGGDSYETFMLISPKIPKSLYILFWHFFSTQAKKVAIYIARAKTEKTIHVLTEELRVSDFKNAPG